MLSIWIFHNCLFPYFPDTTKDVEAPKRIKRKTDRLTAYACEDSTLNITCGQDLYLDVIRANYGRFSITICNDHGNTDWKVDCQAGRTLRAMQARCSNQHDCIVPVQSSIFGDPCPGTFKYIEVHYACRKGTYKVWIIKRFLKRFLLPFPLIYFFVLSTLWIVMPNVKRGLPDTFLPSTVIVVYF